MLYIFIILVIVVVEYRIKSHMDMTLKPGEKREILGGKIILSKHYNRGMFLNFLEDKVSVVKKITGVLLGILILGFAVLLPRREGRLLKFAMALCLGGAISNVIDRWQRGYVVDYFSFNHKRLKTIVFNLADMCIFLGSILMMLGSVFVDKAKECSDEINK